MYNSYHEGREPVFDPKPAYLAARTLTTVFRGYRFERRQATAGDDEYILFFRKGNEVRIAAWTTAEAPRQAIIKVDPGNYSVTSHTGASSSTVRATQTGLSVALRADPVYFKSSQP